MTIVRKKSPRAPSISLDDAIEKVGKIYDKERCHAAPIQGVAQHLGYKSATNGAVLSTMASLKYYGLLDRPKEGMVAVSKRYEEYRFAPQESIKRELISGWLKSPPVFSDLLEKYTSDLPSDATLKFDLIQKGFAPAAADVCLQVFRKSVGFAGYFDGVEETASDGAEPIVEFAAEVDEVSAEPQAILHRPSTVMVPTAAPHIARGYAQTVAIDVRTPPVAVEQEGVDRIPVRLSGGRRAWIEVPTPFYEADRERLKKQIDLLITDDEDSGAS
ncbi:hypothetical protein [Vogesella sp. AC12]|uniref:hypothetical protein n=1 Tax=Vogesella sp. AC12 TaxID=2950550 RepID=UPI00210EB3EB|nr:hypothetical protein [Vogesella sp. AC12]MCQ4142833.1 hypothetical protein [Vogesella sp. AC12]